MTGESLGIPTAMTSAEAETLASLAQGKMVLEVGALLGYSTVLLAQAAEHVVSVDPHEGYPAENPRPTLEPFLNNLERFGVREKVTVCLGRDDEVLPYLAERQFQLVFIDCTGEYETTLAAMHRAVPLLAHHASLAVHDCGHPDWPGALQAVEDFAKERNTTFQLIDSLGVFTQTWERRQVEEARSAQRPIAELAMRFQPCS